MEKLIRDNIPEYVLKKENKVLNTRIADNSEMLNLLKNKLVEEANEVLNTTNLDDLAEELADVLEVIKELSNTTNITDNIFSKRESKFFEKGGFTKRIVLIGECGT